MVVGFHPHSTSPITTRYVLPPAINCRTFAAAKQTKDVRRHSTTTVVLGSWCVDRITPVRLLSV